MEKTKGRPGRLRNVLLIFIIGSVLAVSGASIAQKSAQDDPEVFRVPEPAPGGRFSAIQGANAKRAARNEITPEYLRAAGVFLDRCSSCHGEYGWGDGPWHTEFHPNPANLTLVNDSTAMIRSIILNGVPNTMMPAFPDLSNQTIDEIFDFIALQPRDLSNEWDYPWELAQKLGKKIDDPDIKAGRQQYVSWCIGCHGENGTGDGVMTQSPYIWPRPANFRARNSDVGRLYFLISQGREGTFMPPQDDKLPQLARWRLAQYVESLYDVNQKATIRQPGGNIPNQTNPYLRVNMQAADYGRQRYDLWCAPCHASGARGSYLAPRLIDRKWKYADGTDTAVWTIIKEGVPGKLMISFDEINPDERWKIITFLRYMGGLPDPLASLPKPMHQPQQQDQQRPQDQGQQGQSQPQQNAEPQGEK